MLFPCQPITNYLQLNLLVFILNGIQKTGEKFPTTYDFDTKMRKNFEENQNFKKNTLPLEGQKVLSSEDQSHWCENR